MPHLYCENKKEVLISVLFPMPVKISVYIAPTTSLPSTHYTPSITVNSLITSPNTVLVRL